MKVTPEEFEKFCSELDIELLDYQKEILRKALNERPLYVMMPRKVFLFRCEDLATKLTQKE